MNYIVFDLEWNQNPSGKKTRNDRLPFEIIEIGAVKVNSKKEIDYLKTYSITCGLLFDSVKSGKFKMRSKIISLSMFVPFIKGTGCFYLF
jgi:hypothetical protein